MSSHPLPNDAWFPPTAWTVIRAVPAPGTAAYRDALNILISAYWRPVFYFLRARGYSMQQAEDLTQGFFGRFFEKDLVRRADPSRGRFRTFLLAVLCNYLSDQGPAAPIQKQFEAWMLSVGDLLGDEESTYEPTGGVTAEKVYNQKWAVELIRDVRERLRRLCEERGQAEWYAVFAAMHVDVGVDGPPRQEELAQRLGMSRDQVRYRLKQVTAWFGALLRARLRHEVGSDVEIDVEVRELQAALM
jgi:RNA polymerase sigma-70 factor (ECF subfamily)